MAQVANEWINSFVYANNPHRLEPIGPMRKKGFGVIMSSESSLTSCAGTLEGSASSLFKSLSIFWTCVGARLRIVLHVPIVGVRANPGCNAV